VWYGFLFVIDLGNEMEWRILLELTEVEGSVRRNEVAAGCRALSGASPEKVGLTLAEGKSILASMQTHLVQS
jgi:hypothetical protein